MTPPNASDVPSTARERQRTALATVYGPELRARRVSLLITRISGVMRVQVGDDLVEARS